MWLGSGVRVGVEWGGVGVMVGLRVGGGVGKDNFHCPTIASCMHSHLSGVALEYGEVQLLQRRLA